MAIRSLVRSLVGGLSRSAIGGDPALISVAAGYLGGNAPYHWWDFVSNRALFAGADVGVLASTPNWSFARASTGYAQDSSGLLLPFASGDLRRTDRGILLEAARTNLCLYSNDQTNAAWTKTNVTAAQNQTGPDGIANSACSLTATAGNGTCLQSITSASANRYGSIWIKRLTGTGNIDITLDGGTAWTTISVTSSWQRLGKAQTSVTNPNFGLRIVTSGDAVAVMFGQVESADFPSSPITTTSGSATRAADALSVSSIGVSYPLTLYCEIDRAVDAGVSQNAIQIDDGSANNRAVISVSNTDAFSTLVVAASSTVATVPVGTSTVGTRTRVAARILTDSVNTCAAGSLAGADTLAPHPATPSTFRFGTNSAGANYLFGYLARVGIFNSGLSDANLQAATTS